MTKEQYVSLYEKSVSGNCTEEEKVLLENYRDDFSLDILYWDEKMLGNEYKIKRNIYSKLLKSIKRNPTKVFKWYKIPIAAALVLGMLGFGIYLNIQNNGEKLVRQKPDVMNDNILPGSSKAVLTLEDGSSIILDELENGVVANQSNSVVNKETDGSLVYTSSKAATGQEQIKYNSIVVPRGGEYQLVLPDGTKVWLNSESFLRFPVAFIGKERRVELSGEAYFEVAKNERKPFRVLAKGTEINVLGTHFNVNAYNNAVNTTLIEGAVKLVHKNVKAILKPGQSGMMHKGAFKIGVADIEAVVAWKKGYFIFHDESLKSIMEKVSRWYDIDVEYRGGVENKEFYAKISRQDNLKEMLSNIELTGMVKFKIVPEESSGAARRVIAMP